MKEGRIEKTVGFFVLMGFFCLIYLSISFGNLDIFGNKYYKLSAQFSSVSGLKKGAVIEMAGVNVGKVADINLDEKTQRALVKMKISKEVKITDDAIASVKTSGLIGEKYIKITPGASDFILDDGNKIIDTESALDIEDLISKYVFGSVK